MQTIGFRQGVGVYVVVSCRANVFSPPRSLVKWVWLGVQWTSTWTEYRETKSGKRGEPIMEGPARQVLE